MTILLGIAVIIGIILGLTDKRKLSEIISDILGGR